MIDTLHMILPGLFHSIGKFEDQRECYPSLYKLITKATVVPDRPESFEGVLKQHFAGFSAREIPAGALTAFANSLASNVDNQTWLRADPVYLKSDAHGIYCYGNQHLHIERAEAQAIVESLNQHFAEDGLHIQIASNHAWVLSVDGHQAMATNALADIEGRSIEPMLPSGPDALTWHRRLTETQLLLERHPVNLARRDKGLLPINSLWFWGLGSLPAKMDTYFDCVYVNSKMMQGICDLANTPYYSRLQCFDEFFQSMSHHAHHTCAIIDSRFKRANNLTDMSLREELLTSYEKHWFSQIANALIEGQIKTIYLDACQGRRFVISKRHFKYFWRNNQNVMTCDS